MICVYPADCTDFSTNGNGTLSPLSAEATETLNGEYELTLVHPIDEAGKWQRLVEGCILRAPVPAAMTPRANFSASGDDKRTEVWRVNTDFSGAETRKGTLRLRSGPGTKYKVLATYKNGSFVQVIAKTNSSWYEVTAPDGKHGYMSTTYLVLDHTEGSASEATSSVVESRQLRDQPFRIYRVVPELDKITVYEYSDRAKARARRYIVIRKNENGFDEPIAVRWDRVHGRRRKAVKRVFKQVRRDVKEQYTLFNSYVGREDVLYIHARLGTTSWTDEKIKAEITRQPWFLAEVDDSFDSSYCDIYARIGKEKIQ